MPDGIPCKICGLQKKDHDGNEADEGCPGYEPESTSAGDASQEENGD